MNRVVLAGALSVAVIAGLAATAAPKLNRAPEISDTEMPARDFGEPLSPLGEPAGAFDGFGDFGERDVELPAEPPTNTPNGAAATDNQGLEEFAALILRALSETDPDQLEALSDALQDKIPALMGGSAELDASEALEVMQLYGTLASGGYVLDLTEPLIFEPAPFIALEPIIIEPSPLLVKPLDMPPPPPFIAQPTPGDSSPGRSAEPPEPPLPDIEYADGYFRDGVAIVPDIRVGRGDNYDQQFDRFFSLSFSAAMPVRLLRLEVDRPGHLSMRAFHDPDAINWVAYTLRSDAGPQWTTGRDDLIWVQPGGYDLIVRLSDRSVTGSISMRIEINDPLDKTEPNDLKEQAVPIELPFRRRVFLEGNEDVDWFSFTIGEEGVLSAASNNAGLEVYGPDGELLPLPDTESGTRYLIVPPGGYYLRVLGNGSNRVGQVTLRHYPPSDIAAEINRIIGVGLESDPETATQMRAVSYATGAPLVETIDANEIAAALEEASGANQGISWWVWLGLIVGILVSAGAYFLIRKKQAGN